METFPKSDDKGKGSSMTVKVKTGEFLVEFTVEEVWEGQIEGRFVST